MGHQEGTRRLYCQMVPSSAISLSPRTAIPFTQ